MFYDEMMGFRPERGCRKALQKLNNMIEMYILDADVRGFFDHIDHEWAVRFIESRIKDPNIIRLVRKMLKAGVMEGYEYGEAIEGSGQGSVCSPIIADIYALCASLVVQREGLSIPAGIQWNCSLRG